MKKISTILIVFFTLIFPGFLVVHAADPLPWTKKPGLFTAYPAFADLEAACQQQGGVSTYQCQNSGSGATSAWNPGGTVPGSTLPWQKNTAPCNDGLTPVLTCNSPGTSQPVTTPAPATTGFPAGHTCAADKECGSPNFCMTNGTCGQQTSGENYASGHTCTSTGQCGDALTCDPSSKTCLAPSSVAANSGNSTSGAGGPVQGVAPFSPLTALPGISDIGNGSTNNFPVFINSLYKVCIGIAATLAVIIIMKAGVEFMTNTGSVSSNEKAKADLQNAVLGLVLVLSPAIVFGIINPRILNLSLDFSSLQPPATTINLNYASTTVPDVGDGSCNMSCAVGTVCKAGSCVSAANTSACQNTVIADGTDISSSLQSQTCCAAQPGCKVVTSSIVNNFPATTCSCGSGGSLDQKATACSAYDVTTVKYVQIPAGKGCSDIQSGYQKTDTSCCTGSISPIDGYTCCAAPKSGK